MVKEGKEEMSVLEQVRRRRLECRDIVDAANKTFQEIAFVSLFANVPLMVAIAYGMVTFSEKSEFEEAIAMIALLGSLIQVLVVTIAAAWVHEYVGVCLFVFIPFDNFRDLYMLILCRHPPQKERFTP